MQFTGEFFIPTDAETGNMESTELEIEHRQRYLSILKMVEGKTVLDIASGEGYGAHILSSKAKQVFGVDINPELVEHAGRKYNRANIRFLEGSVARIPLASGSVDIIASFETLEHVSADIQQQFLLEVKRVLRPDGVFVVSTPDKKNYTDRYSNHNEFHLLEFYKDDFEQFLKKHFGHVILYEQGHEVTSLILNKEDYLLQKPVAMIPVTNNYHFEGKYMIGLCSDLREAIQPSLASIVPESEKSYFQLIDRILQLQEEVATLGNWGKRSAEALDASNAGIRQLEEQRKQQENDRDKLVHELQKVSQEKAATEENLESVLEDLARSNHDRFLKDAELAALRQITPERQSYSFGLEKLTEEIGRFIMVISEETNGGTDHKQPPEGLPTPVSAPTTDPGQQIIRLQEELQWYKRTYEQRSLLGVIREKITAKFHK